MCKGRFQFLINWWYNYPVGKVIKKLGQDKNLIPPFQQKIMKKIKSWILIKISKIVLSLLLKAVGKNENFKDMARKTTRWRSKGL